MIRALTQEEVLWVWPRLQSGIRKALTRSAGDSWTEQDLFRLVALGSGRVLIAVDGEEIFGCVVANVYEREKGKCFYILAMAGVDHRRWVSEMNETVRAMAKSAGCYCLEALCADGVERVIQHHGWRRKAVLMEMSL